MSSVSNFTTNINSNDLYENCKNGINALQLHHILIKQLYMNLEKFTWK